MQTLSDRLKSARKSARLTQQQLAKKAAVSQQMISDLERGRSESTKDIGKLAQALGASADWLLGTSVQQVDEMYELLMSLPEDRRQEAVEILRTLARRRPA